MQLPRVGNHVSVYNASTEGFDPLGRVMGFGTSNGEPIVIVNLDDARYIEGREFFITNLVVHASCIQITNAVSA